MQTRHVREPPTLDGGEIPSIRQLISVFLSPDEGLDFSGAAIAERTGEQRLDGVLRFGDELVVVIESKVVGAASSNQAQLLRLRGVEVEELPTIVALGWHELLEDWWALLERSLLAPAERVLMEDLVAFSEEYFAHLLPFTTLAAAGEHDLGRQRRLMALLREATGMDDVKRGTAFSAEVMLDAAVRARSTQRLALKCSDDGLALFTWPGELKDQAAVLYQTERAKQLVELMASDPDAWKARANPHLAYRSARPTQRLYPKCRLEPAEYVRRWQQDDGAQIGAHAHSQVRDRLWPWLRERGYASAEDDDRVDDFLNRLGRRDAHLRPGIEVRRLWPWKQAVDLDEQHKLAGEIRQAVTQVLTALDEPLPPGCQVDTPVTGHSLQSRGGPSDGDTCP